LFAADKNVGAELFLQKLQQRSFEREIAHFVHRSREIQFILEVEFTSENPEDTEDIDGEHSIGG